MQPIDAPLRKGLSNQEKEYPSLKVLLHCRTVVEKANFVTTGVMTQVEGELFEIELNEFDLFELGEAVKLTVYSPAGIQSFQSVVFAKYEGAIAIFQPPALSERFQEKREFYRVNAEGTVRILRVIGEDGGVRQLPEPLEAELFDISLGGLGIRMPESRLIEQASRLGAVVHLGFAFDCELALVRRERLEHALHYGMRMKLLDAEMLRPLRAFVLRRQVEIQSRNRQQASGKKR